MASCPRAWARTPWAMTADQALHRRLVPPAAGMVALAAKILHVLVIIKKISSTRPMIPTPRAKVHLPRKHSKLKTHEREHRALVSPHLIKRKNRKSPRKTRRRRKTRTIPNQTMMLTTTPTVMTAMMTPMRTARTAKRKPRETRGRRDSWARPPNLADRSLDRRSLLQLPLPPSSSL